MKFPQEDFLVEHGYYPDRFTNANSVIAYKSIGERAIELTYYISSDWVDMKFVERGIEITIGFNSKDRNILEVEQELLATLERLRAL
jgi:hypothetical protein